jgi:hypothetical protein
MPRETLPDKAARYLTSGRIVVTEATPSRIRATAEGDTGTYQLGWASYVRGGWYCRCPAFTPACVHLTALKLITRPATARTPVPAAA